ncbi:MULTISPECIES: prepilin-type N-terminal cleavage/methylation domain-containing protein [unclassified Delftia]|uniref:prepilin-type N-terminal cleavage/methylation domain-containing protein n=1 Tax=unclassified Delftia TaxID=2613839 RepID=UPI00190150E1|nr:MULTISPECIES: prepilin-type N-terminal cleavage/methylation domain-containing protein [unclassified Delftia]MBK0116103.1 prepilin-type N-terminal cleavage/methylation domain-containing protein [Delftia sp. S65]MBK0120671.1 prepilin-type N-terminal cleavage/methylation domain-containing protein [Delftia sp. S67]MBK0132308.1 prepilin-type N-terminal cleavage/methylation domain-containing protein [Delftia sp. S66]
MKLRGMSSSGQRGFTLVELLVVMTLLSLLMLGLASAMSTVSQTQERVDARLDRMDHQRVSISFLRTVLGQVSAERRRGGQRMQGQSPFFFQAGPKGMQWLGIMPARFGLGGRTHFQLALEGDALVLRFTAWRGANMEPDWGQSQSYVVERAVSAFSLSYQNAKLGASRWTPLWEDEKELPSAVQIQLQTSTGAWPLMVVSFLTPSATNPSVGGGGPAFGGGR